MSGDPLKDDQPIKVLGLIWDTEKDRFQIDIKVNFSGKGAGARTASDINLEEFLQDEDLLLTKRIIWRVAMAQYDPLGLLAPYTMQLKLVMRFLCPDEGEKKRGWDDVVMPNIEKDFKQVVSGLAELRKISFPRSIHPKEKVKGAPSLLVFGDGSRDVYCVMAYARWPMSNGSFKCYLITCKTKVAPH